MLMLVVCMLSSKTSNRCEQVFMKLVVLVRYKPFRIAVNSSNTEQHSATSVPRKSTWTKVMYASYLAPNLPWGGHFPDQFLWAFLLSFAVRGLVSRTGAGDSHMCVDTRGRRRPFLRFLSRGGIKTAKVSLSPVCRSLPLLERRVIQRLGKVSPRCHLSLLLWKRRLCLEIV